MPAVITNQVNEVLKLKSPSIVFIPVPNIADMTNAIEKFSIKNNQVVDVQFAFSDEDYWDSNCLFMKSVNGKSMNCRIDRKAKANQINNLRSLLKKPMTTSISSR